MNKTTIFFSVLLSLLIASGMNAAGGETGVTHGGSSVDLKPYFPEARAIDANMKAEDYREYDRGSLYDYIDGGAEVYLDLDFVEVGAREYVIELDGEEVYFTLDVYDMSRPVNAFGIYSAEAHGDAPAVDAGVEGYIGGGALAYWTQRFYVKIRADYEGETVNGLLRKFAGLVSSRIGDPGELPPELSLFPARDRVPASARYAARNLLGVGPLKGFSIRFERGGDEITLHLCRFESEAETMEAEKALSRRLQFSASGSTEGRGAPFASKYFGQGRVRRAGVYLGIAQGLAGNEDEGSWAASLVDEFFTVIAGAGSS